MVSDRLQPNDITAEESVIGSLLIDGEALTRIAGSLKPTDFYSHRNRLCYQACFALYERNEPINQVTVAHELARQTNATARDLLTIIGGSEYLSALVANVPTSVHIEHYGEIVRKTSVLRALIRAGVKIVDLGHEGGPDDEEVIAQAEELLYGVRTGRAGRDFSHIRLYLDNYMEQTGALGDPTVDSIAPVPTGYPNLDELLGGGLQRSDLIILAARPSLGKSTLAINAACHAAQQGLSVGVFSLEMSGEQVAVRLIASEADLDGHRLRLNLLREEEDQRVIDAIGMLSDLPLYIDETPLQTVMDLRGKARRLQQERGLDLLVVDYLQLVDTGRSDNRAIALGEVSRSLKAVARELDIPVLACSQLSRAVEQRPNHRPLLSDLRESGSLEQDSDVVMFIHREDRYTTREEWERKHPAEGYPENIAEIMVAKHRNGPVGTVQLYFRNDRVRFETLDAPLGEREMEPAW